MKIIVVGCGKIGMTIVETFVNEGHEVVAMDNNPAVITAITNMYDAFAVCGNGVDCETLTEAGVEKAHLFVAATGSDELNMLSCFLARRMGAKHTIARIRNPEYNDQSLVFMKQQLNLSMPINPELLTAQELFKILKLPSAVTVETFSQRNFEMVELVLREGSPLDGVSLMELRRKIAAKFLVCVVHRADKVYIPDGSFVLKAGDRIGISAVPSEIHKLLRIIGMMQKQAKSVMILGASRIAYYLAKMLLDNGTTVKIIDRDHKRCEEISNLLPGAIVIEGDGIQQELLLEEGLESVDALVALTGIDEQNILVSAFASTHQVPKVIAKVNKNELASMAGQLGLDCVVSPKKFVADVVSRYGRALQNSVGSKVETLYKLMGGKAEALEFRVQADFKGVDVPLKDLALKPDILIAGIIRGRKAILPTGDDMIQLGDKVVVVAAGKQMWDLSDILM
jgi:trk system potassium uptake protein TrkA